MKVSTTSNWTSAADVSTSGKDMREPVSLLTHLCEVGRSFVYGFCMYWDYLGA